MVRGLAFGSDATRLAIAQSDNIVFVYKIGSDWGERKSICNKFPQSSSVTCVIWPKERQNDVYFGCSDGKVRIGRLRSNKTEVQLSTDS